MEKRMLLNDYFLRLMSIVLMTSIPQGGDSIRCYECVHNSQRMKKYSRYIYPCFEFDGSYKYIRDCPSASLCVYQVISLPLFTEEIRVRTMDGCTPNSTDRSRYTEVKLAKEGCIKHSSLYSPTTAEYCYCSSDLCNTAADTLRKSSHYTMYSTLFLILLVTVIHNYMYS